MPIRAIAIIDTLSELWPRTFGFYEHGRRQLALGLKPRRIVSSCPKQEPDEPAHKIERVAFTTSRLMEFCTEKELLAQSFEWPRVVIKELVDNGLDHCEEASRRSLSCAPQAKGQSQRLGGPHAQSTPSQRSIPGPIPSAGRRRSARRGAQASPGT